MMCKFTRFGEAAAVCHVNAGHVATACNGYKLAV